MTNFNIDLDVGSTERKLRDLNRRYSTEPIYVVESGAEYSLYIEFGRGPVRAQEADALQFENEAGETIYRTSVSGHPPYPFFRPAIREFVANPETFILKNTDLDGLDGVNSSEELVKTAAFALEAQMKKNATANSAGRSPGTHPNHPQVQSGNLRARIIARRLA